MDYTVRELSREALETFRAESLNGNRPPQETARALSDLCASGMLTETEYGIISAACWRELLEADPLRFETRSEIEARLARLEEFSVIEDTIATAQRQLESIAVRELRRIGGRYDVPSDKALYGHVLDGETCDEVAHPVQTLELNNDTVEAVFKDGPDCLPFFAFANTRDMLGCAKLLLDA